MAEQKTAPKCRLPDIFTAPHLIGKTVVSLKEAGNPGEVQRFIDEIENFERDMDFYDAFDIARKYVEFCD